MPTFDVTDPQSGRTLSLNGDSPPTEQELEEVFSQFKDAPSDVPRMAQDSGEALLTNLPPRGFGQSFVRGLPAAGGGLAGASAGALAGAPLGPGGMIVGGILGAGLGGAAGESTRQAVSQVTAGAFPEQNYPMASGRDVMRDVGIQGAFQAGGQALGVGVGAAAKALRPAANRLGAAFTKVAANVPENSGQAATADPGRLSRAPSQEAVSGAYDDFHRTSGTMSRKQSIAASSDPFDNTARAMGTMRDAYNKLRSGALSVQEAVEASQAGRLIRDMKSRGVEMAQEIAEQASTLKGQFDDFIERGIGPRTEIGDVPVAQELLPVTRTTANKLAPKTDVFESARTLVPETVNTPVSGSESVLSDLRKLVGVVKQARAQGVNPKSILTDSEKSLYGQFGSAIDSSVQHNVPIESLVTPSEAVRQTAGFAERTMLRPGDPIYAGSRKLVFDGPIEETALLPGEMVMGRGPVQVPAQPGFPEWQTARQMAFERAVADDFGSVLPRNVNGQPNVLRTWSAAGGGATTGAGIGAMVGGPAGAAVGGVLGAVGGIAGVSPLAYGTALKGMALAGRALPTIYRVGVPTGAAAAGSALADAYARQRLQPAR